jgi:hypothetical protein
MTTESKKVKNRRLSKAMMGNRNALGNEGGRPPKYDLEKEADVLLEWAKKPDSTALYQFTNDKEYLYDDLDDFAIRSPKFSLALKKAKELIGQHREEHCNIGTMNYGVWSRSQAIYHAHLHKFERAEKAYEVELKTKADAALVPPQDAIVERDNENMALKAELAALREKIDNITKARQELPGSDTQI